ncbi:MAG TPA: hypothetical protein VMU80_26185 [Bryobacteraceae bacterium]|nr:hypothetical protein [Bryobacteraceae bacterium]
MTRRMMAKLLGWALLPLVVRRTEAEEPSTARRYRADAQVLILSIPLLRRSGVGGGSALWREWRDSGGLMRQLEFTGYSDPARAAGLNRLGFIRETSCREQAAIREANYFGVMSASPEDSAEEAHKALHSTATEATYTAIEGHIEGGHVETASVHFTGPARFSPSRREELVSRAEEALSTAPKKPSEFHTNGAIPAPFLHALVDALRSPGVGQTEYVYSGRLYRLWIRQSPDSHAADYFRQRGILGGGVNVVRINGKVRREAGGKETDFRLWIEAGAAQPVPLRIDFQPKSYLRLIMEAEA